MLLSIYFSVVPILATVALQMEDLLCCIPPPLMDALSASTHFFCMAQTEMPKTTMAKRHLTLQLNVKKQRQQLYSKTVRKLEMCGGQLSFRGAWFKNVSATTVMRASA